MKSRNVKDNLKLAESILKEISSNPNNIIKTSYKHFEEAICELKYFSKLELQHYNEKDIRIMQSVNTVVMNFDEDDFEPSAVLLLWKLIDAYLKQHLEEKELTKVKLSTSAFIEKILL